MQNTCGCFESIAVNDGVVVGYLLARKQANSTADAAAIICLPLYHPEALQCGTDVSRCYEPGSMRHKRVTF